MNTFSLTNNDVSATNNRSACAYYDNAVALFGLSKSFACPGLRLGWICTKNQELYDMMAKLKDYLTICPPAPSEVLALIALRNKEKVLEKTLSLVKNNLALLAEFCSRYPRFLQWFPPRAGTVGFLRLTDELLEQSKGGATGFCEEVLAQRQLLLLPASQFDFDDKYVRIGFGREGLPGCLVQLEEFLKTFK